LLQVDQAAEGQKDQASRQKDEERELPDHQKRSAALKDLMEGRHEEESDQGSR
jgi:hypothetical protein